MTLDKGKLSIGAVASALVVMVSMGIQAWRLTDEMSESQREFQQGALLKIESLSGKIDVLAVRSTALESAVTDMRDQTSAIPGLRAEVSFLRESLGELRGQLRDRQPTGGAPR